MELEHWDAKGMDYEMKPQISDVIPTPQLFMYMTLIVLNYVRLTMHHDIRSRINPVNPHKLYKENIIIILHINSS